MSANRSVNLVGLDFGTTTSSAVVATAQLAYDAVTGRSQLSQLSESCRSEIVFTPMRGDALDLEQLEAYLQTWLATTRREEIFGGGALLTGLTAQKANAAALIDLIERHLGAALIATADDPCFESWLAFMGSCADLSRNYPDTPIINLDIGGGTTNLALGKHGEVLRTGCLFVGARHVQVEPGTYRIVKLSRYAKRLFENLGIGKEPGDSLAPEEVERILDFYLKLLEAAAAGDQEPFENPIARLHEQSAFRPPPLAEKAIVTLSGGVGELVYSHVLGQPWPSTTAFGDLGIDLARRLAGVSAWTDHFRSYIPAGSGRATVYGLLQYSTQVSGNTLFLPNPGVLPLRNVPIVGSISLTSTDEDICRLLDLIRRSPKGGCLRVKLAAERGLTVSGPPPATTIPELGRRLGGMLEKNFLPAGHPLILVMEENLGKVLGNYVINWGRIRSNVVVIDEIKPRDARFIQIGSLRNHVVPVSFHGMN
jgi:ethanolamine utilization protein EutA